MSDSEKTYSPPPTLADLARQTVDLWQEEMARLATQPETVALVARALSTFMAASGMTSDATGNPENSPGPARSTAKPSSSAWTSYDSSSCSPTSGPIPASSSHHTGTTAHNDAPMDGDNLLKCLLNHVVQLEQRVDKLERELDGKLQNGGSTPLSRHPESIS